MRRCSSPLLVLCLSLGLGACVNAAVPELRIGINSWPGYEFLYLAQERGLFDTTVAHIRLLEFSSLSDTRRAFERGQLDGFAGTMIEVLQAREQSSWRRVVALVSDNSEGADVLIATAGGPDVRALRGRRVGVELNTLNVYLLSRALERVGSSLDEVTMVSVDLMGMADALARGRVDAVATYPPASMQAMQVPGAHVRFSSREIPGEVIDVIAVDSAMIPSRVAAVAELVRGFERARRYADRNPAEAYTVMAGREGVTPVEFAAALRDGIRIVSLEEQGPFLQTQGRIDTVAARVGGALIRTGQLAQPPSLDGIGWEAAVAGALHRFDSRGAGRP